VHGPLSEIGLIEVLQLLERGGRSGTLRVVGPDPSAPRVLRIDGGRLVAIEPDADDRAVARALVRQHLVIADDEVEAPVGPAFREGVRDRLARRALGMLLHWTRGRFDFDEGATEPGPLSWSADAMVLALVSAESRQVELAEALDGWHVVPEFCSPEAIAAGGPITLETLDWRLLDACDGVRDVAALAALLEEPLEVLGERIQLLEAAAILQLRPAVQETMRDARSAIGSGEYDDAVAQLRARVAAAPRDAEAWRSLGLAEVGAGRFDHAVEAWTAWLETAPERRADADALIRAATTMMEALSESRD
jgi:tetratricopeptide (TPR) repeat protein